MRKFSAILLCLFVLNVAALFAQYPGVSLGTDVSLQRNFSKNQIFWSVGHTVQAQIPITEKNGAYIAFGYITNGLFANQLTATAKNTSTNPAVINYKNNAAMKLRHLSIGWRHYIKGSPAAEQGWSIYGFAGFGLTAGDITNVHSVVIDTVQYAVPVLSGSAKFKRLTLDVGGGFEKLLGGDIYLYTEARANIPASDYPSKFLLTNRNAPFTAALALGLRLLF
ncbi:MAG: hypothetical protein RIR12_1723 [Bacteroidota bacterium]|jgi:hypothetical protein